MRHATRIGFLLCLTALPALSATALADPPPCATPFAGGTIVLRVEPGGTGDCRATPCARITDALAAARALRAGSAAPITIQVQPGHYDGSSDPVLLAKNPRLEVLPLLLDIGGLSLVGATAVDTDAYGLPTGARPGTETVVRDDAQLGGQVDLVLIAPTGPAGAPPPLALAGPVLVQGLVLDGRGVNGGFSFGVRALGVDGFCVEGNVVQGGWGGTYASYARGRVEANLVAHTLHVGMGFIGGAAPANAEYLVRGNRSTFAPLWGAFVISRPDGRVDDSGAQLNLPSLGGNTGRAIGGIVPTADNATGIVATFAGNDFSNNNDAGLMVMAWGLPFLTAVDLTSIAARLTIAGNAMSNNGQYGVVIHSGFNVVDGASFQAAIALANNAFSGNGRAAGVLTTRAESDIALTGNHAPSFAPLRDSTIAVTDDGEIAAFDYDLPAGLGNSVTVNGVEHASGCRVSGPGNQVATCN